MTYYTYILECRDGSYYTGSTDNLYNRVLQHNEGRGAKYTRVRLPAKLIYHEEFESRSEAVRRELAIKKLSKDQKKKLVDSTA